MDTGLVVLLFVFTPVSLVLQGCGGSEFQAETDKVFKAWGSHQKAFQECNVEDTVNTYADDAVVSFVNHVSGDQEVFGQGKAFVRKVVGTMYDRVRNFGTGITTIEYIDNTSTAGPQKGINTFNNVVWQQWRAPDADGYAYTWAADNFVYNKEGKIQTHTMFYSGGGGDEVDVNDGPLRLDTEDKSYYSAWQSHAEAFSNCNLTAFVATYADDAVLSFVNHETGIQETVGQGPKFVQKTFAALFSQLCDPDSGKTIVELIDGTKKKDGASGDIWSWFGDKRSDSPFVDGVNIIGNVAFTQWKAANHYEWATNTVVYNTDKKVSVHTMWYHPDSDMLEIITE